MTFDRGLSNNFCFPVIINNGPLSNSNLSCEIGPLDTSTSTNDSVASALLLPCSPSFVVHDGTPLNKALDTSSLSMSSPPSCASVQARAIDMVGHLGPPRGLAIGDDDGADAGVPSWLTRLFHPPER